MTATILPLRSRGLAQHGNTRALEGATPHGQGIEVIRLDGTIRHKEDALLGVSVRVSQTLLIPPDRANRAAELISQLLLAPSLLGTPLGKLHESARLKKPLPKWLYGSLALWQYANMAKCQIVYIRRVANDDDAPNRIQELCDAQGITQAELARRANVSVSALNKVVKGTRGLDQEWMRRLAPHLGVTPAELLPVDDNPLLLSHAERDLIARFRAADEKTRLQLERVAEAVLPAGSRSAEAA